MTSRPARIVLALGLGAMGFTAYRYLTAETNRGIPVFNSDGTALPVIGFRVTSRFGPRRDPITGAPKNHSGLDLGGLPVGAPVYAPVGGRVTLVHYDGIGQGIINGNAVHIRDAQGNLWSLLHLSRILVSVGDVVKPGDVVGLLGSTGRSTGPHLHLQVMSLATRQNLDPERFFPSGTFG